MMLRLILVGLVVGLGLSLPSRRDFDTMTRCAQHWVTDRFAEWDSPSLSDQGAYVYVVEPTESVLPLAAPTPAFTSASIVPSVPVSPPISDEEFASVLNDSMTTFAQDILANTTHERDQQVESHDPLVALESAKSLMIDFPVEPIALPDDELSRIDLTELVFEGWAEELASTTPVELTDTTTNSDVTDPIDQAFEAVVDATVMDFGQDAVASTLAAADAERSLSDELVSLDDEARSQAEAHDSDRGPAAAGGETRHESRLTNAVRLTREAVVAWASLIHGPAVITIAR